MDKKYHDIDRLRLPERLARLEVNLVTELCIEGIDARSMLDVGAGNGVFTEAFSLHGIDVSGLDENEEMIASAEQHVPQAVFRQGSADNLPWPDHSFDLVFLGLVLHEVESPLAVLMEAHRVARNRVAVLEWPYKAQEFGPPLSHRLRPGDITEFALSIGFRKVELIVLTNLLLYRFGT
ncbi:MAG: class I SAM-dependent methyltransferase [Candidatus Latescibacterota bacterium]|jgi:ubiquinone/menaquinone biosynthesis C-methylase UbiE